MALDRPAGRGRLVIVWFRNDLRLHDHVPLLEAVALDHPLLPLYVLDPRHFGPGSFGYPRTGSFRARFLIDALAGLRASLRPDVFTRFRKSVERSSSIRAPEAEPGRMPPAGARSRPRGRYVKHWLPELAGLPASRVHEPWKASPAELSRAGLELGRDYPRPIVDFRDSIRLQEAAYEAAVGRA